MGALGKPVRRMLHLWHRRLGVAMCALLAMWFLSGMVMMYVGFPDLDREERFAGLSNLDGTIIATSPTHVAQLLRVHYPVRSIRLTQQSHSAVYVVDQFGSLPTAYDALSLEEITGISGSDAQISAGAFYRKRYDADTAPNSTVSEIELDQWTVSSSLNPHRPLFRVSFDDAANTELYVPSVTGEVVRDTRRRERMWNWLGANLHWIYPLALRRHGDLWSTVVITLSILGLLAIVTGTLVGIQRIRLRKRYRGTHITPYAGVQKLHHLLGLIGMTFL
jgi:hypothetical protein